MIKALVLTMSVLCLSSLSLAESVPRCWNADQPGQHIKEGLFRVFVPTPNHSAQQVALVLGLLSQSSAGQTGVGSSDHLEYIEMDVVGDLEHWESSQAFPTLESYKEYVLKSISPVLNVPGVTIQCAFLHPHFPVH